MSGWVKLPLEVVLSEKFTALAPALHSVWLRAWVLAKKCNADGLLVDNGSPIALARLATPDVPARKVARVIDELHALGFFDRRAGGVIEVVGWKRAQFGGPSGERMARQRAVTSDVTSDGLTDEIPPGKSVTCDGENPQNGAKKASQVTHRAIEIPSSSGSKLPSSSGAQAQEKSVTCDGEKPIAAPSSLPQWVENIREDVRTFADVLLAKLTLEQRIVLGQYAAFRWAGYTEDETKNLGKARTFAQQIEALGAKHRFREVTVRDFIDGGNRLRAATRHLPLHSLWPIGAAIEESAAAS